MEVCSIIILRNGEFHKSRVYVSDSDMYPVAEQAEQAFKNFIGDSLSDEDKDICLDDGYFEDKETGQTVIISWPEVIEVE